MRFDISRDFLDSLSINHPVRPTDQDPEIQANGGLKFLPSSPDGTMHTAVVSFGLQLQGSDKPFALGGWRFLFTTDEKLNLKEQQVDAGFVRALLINGASKIMAQLNNLCMHANMPVIPIDPAKLAQSVAPVEETPAS